MITSYDLILVARSSSDKLKMMTQNCINSAKADNVILIETYEPTEYEGVDNHFFYNGAFNYNHAINLGLEEAKCDIHILANNDLIFHDYKTIGEDMINNGFGSGSAWFKGCSFPQGELVYPGYEIAVYLTGWCIFITKETKKIIGRLDEGVDFWYSDNLYAEQLKRYGIKHGLFCNARVDHLGSQTLNTMPVNMKRYYSIGQLTKYAKRKRV